MTLSLVKLGGSLLTDKKKKEALKKKRLQRLCREIHSGKKKEQLIVGHGGGSFPHYPAHKYKVKGGIKNKNSLKGFALTSDAAARLNRIVVRELLKAGENAVSVQPSAWLIARNEKIHTSFLEQFMLYLKKGFLPVPYGDAVLDSRLGVTIASTEKVLGELALKLNGKRLIVVTDTEGVFTADPASGKKAEFVPEITDKNYKELRERLKGARGTDVTGGMLHKVEELHGLAKQGIRCQIISGKKKNNLKKALLGKKIGTIIR